MATARMDDPIMRCAVRRMYRFAYVLALAILASISDAAALCGDMFLADIRATGESAIARCKKAVPSCRSAHPTSLGYIPHAREVYDHDFLLKIETSCRHGINLMLEFASWGPKCAMVADRLAAQIAAAARQRAITHCSFDPGSGRLCEDLQDELHEAKDFLQGLERALARHLAAMTDVEKMHRRCHNSSKCGSLVCFVYCGQNYKDSMAMSEVYIQRTIDQQADINEEVEALTRQQANLGC